MQCEIILSRYYLSDQHPGTAPSDILLHSTPIACAIPCGVYKIDRQSRAIRETESQPFFKSELPFAFYRRGVLVLCLGSGGY